MNFRMFALAGVSLVAISTPALAQQAPAAKPEETAVVALDEIIVSARRRDEALQDIPMKVDVVTAAQIQNLNIRDGGEIQTLVPGVQLRNEANGIGGSAQMRGIQYDVNTSASPSVAFYLNDAPVEASSVLQTFYDIGQVSVERGPQGTLRGLSTPSGAIVVVTRKPDLNEAGGYIQTTVNDTGTTNVNGGVGLPIIPGVLAVRAAGAFDQNAGNLVRTVERDGDSRAPQSETKSVRLSALLTPTDYFRVEGVYQRLNRDARSFNQYSDFPIPVTGAIPGVGSISAKDRLSIQENPAYIGQDYEGFNWRAELALMGQRLIYQGQRNLFDVHSVTNQDSANYLNGRDIYQNTTTHSKQISHELRLQNESRIMDRFDYVVGYYHNAQGVRTNLTTQTPILLPVAFGGGVALVQNTPISSLADGELTEASVFGNLTAHLGDSTELSGGLRHMNTSRPTGMLTIGSSPAIVTAAEKDKGTVYVVSLKHNITRSLMVYAMTGTSRRMGPNITGDFSVVKSDFQRSFMELPSETSRSYEAGFRSDLMDNRLRLNLTAYHQTFKNFPFRAPTAVYYVKYTPTLVGGAVTNVPSVEAINFGAAVPVTVNGVEGDATFAITQDWNIAVNASYSMGKIKNGTIACTDLNGDGKDDGLSSPPTLAALQAAVGTNNVSGCKVTQRSAFQAPFSATITSSYQHPINAQMDGFVRGLVSFNGKSLGDPSYAYDNVDAYGLLNLFAGVRSNEGNWEISFFAKNILDKTEVTKRGLAASTSYQRLTFSNPPTVAGSAASNYAQIETTAPREFGVSLRMAFGSK